MNWKRLLSPKKMTEDSSSLRVWDLGCGNPSQTWFKQAPFRESHYYYNKTRAIPIPSEVFGNTAIESLQSLYTQQISQWIIDGVDIDINKKSPFSFDSRILTPRIIFNKHVLGAVYFEKQYGVDIYHTFHYSLDILVQHYKQQMYDIALLAFPANFVIEPIIAHPTTFVNLLDTIVKRKGYFIIMSEFLERMTGLPPSFEQALRRKKFILQRNKPLDATWSQYYLPPNTSFLYFTKSYVFQKQ